MRAESPLCKLWIAPDSHAILAINLNMRAATSLMTHNNTIQVYYAR